MIYYIGSFGLIFIGLYIVLTKKNLIKIIIGLGIMDTGVNLFLISIAYVKGGTAPIFSRHGIDPERMVDPVPQALVLTAIVIGLGVTALMLAYVVRLFDYRKSLDIGSYEDLKW